MEILGVEIPWTIIFSIINLIVLYLLMKKFLFDRVNAIIEERQNLVKGQLANAENAEAEANKKKEEYDGILATADGKADEIIAKAKKEAQEKADNIVNEAQEQASKVIAQANETVRLEKEKTVAEVQSEIASLALAAASKIMEKDVDNESNKKYVDDFIVEASAYDDAGSR